MKKDKLDLLDYLEGAYDQKAAFVIKDAMKEGIYIVITGRSSAQGKSTLERLIKETGYPLVVDDMVYQFENNRRSFVEEKKLKRYLLVDFGCSDESHLNRKERQLFLTDKENLIKVYPTITRFDYRVEYYGKYN